jgi:hypothetical protein
MATAAVTDAFRRVFLSFPPTPGGGLRGGTSILDLTPDRRVVHDLPRDERAGGDGPAQRPERRAARARDLGELRLLALRRGPARGHVEQHPEA